MMLVIYSLLICVIGLVFAMRDTIPQSISSMVYLLDEDRQWVWSLWLAVVAFLMMPSLLVASEWLGWLTVMCLLGTAVTPIIHEYTYKLHSILGILGGIFSQLCVLLISPLWLLVWVAMGIFAIVAYNNDGLMGKYTVLVAEILCAMSLYGALLLP